MRRIASILALLVLAACGAERERVDVPINPPRDGGTAPGACSADTAVQQAGWTDEITVTADAKLCTYNLSDMRRSIGQAIQVELVPGTYKLPSTNGTFDYRFPTCVVDADGTRSGGGRAGTVTHTRTVTDVTQLEYAIAQEVEVDGEMRRLDMGIFAYDRTQAGVPFPGISLGKEVRVGNYPDYEVWYTLCADRDCNEIAAMYPCPEPGDGQTTNVTFERGRLDVDVVVFSSFGPTQPAALVKASGSIDGVTFEQTNYFDLAHRPDHHNLGGAYLVRFDDPIAGACAIEARIPSIDGSFFIDDPSAALLDCGFEPIETLVLTE